MMFIASFLHVRSVNRDYCCDSKPYPELIFLAGTCMFVAIQSSYRDMPAVPAPLKA